MISIDELVRYSTAVRRKFAEKLASLPFQEVDRNREASFHSMKNILLHMIDNEDMMVNYVVRGRSAEYQRRKWEEYTDMPMVLDHLTDIEGKTAAFLADKPVDMAAEASFRTNKGATISLTVEEFLLQSFTEQLYHMGELIALMWQDNVEPPTMQWFNNNPRVRA